MFEALTRSDVLSILSLDGDDQDWREDFDRLMQGDATLTRRSAREGAVRAIQRLVIFLGYSTSGGGSFSVDGDFGRGTNRGIAQFQFEHKLNPELTREQLAYKTTFMSAPKDIVAIPESRLTLPTIGAMLAEAARIIDAGKVTFGNFDDALFHLNALQRGRFLSCKEILERYGEAVEQAVAKVAEESGVQVQPEWVLAIVRQETAGVVRPRFEQHLLSKDAEDNPARGLRELRYRSMSMGLGQILGRNFEAIGAASPEAMIESSASEQLAQVARFLLPRRNIVSKRNPGAEDFATLARFYNGPAFATHKYNESLERWWNELIHLRQGT